MKFRSHALVAALASLTILSACDSAEERADAHYQNAVELLEEGDVSRALVEFRNVFQLDQGHLDARRLYAATMRDQGRFGEAFGSYVYVSERLPDDVDARKNLARLAFELRRWDDLDRHAEAAYEMAPDDPEAQLYHHVVEFRRALTGEDAPARREAARQIAALRETLPDNIAISTVLAENSIQEGEFDTALEEIDRSLALDPDNEEYLNTRINLLLRLGEGDQVEQQLVDMAEAEPENADRRNILLQWHLSRGDRDAAEQILRDAVASENASADDRAALIAFVRQMRGIDAAIAETDALIEAGRGTAILRALRAGLVFDSGDREAAIGELQALIEAEPESRRLNDFKVALARMLQATGNEVGARQQVEEVLADDPGQVDALKMRAAWLVEQDNADEAIIALRRALDQAPRDAQAMTLMANAHLRNGSRELAGEMLSLAVEASGNAPAETLRYARFLLDGDRLSTAESLLVDGLRRTPDNVDILALLGQVYILQEDWSRAEQVEGTLGRIESDAASAAATSLRARRLQQQNSTDELLSFLDQLAADNTNDRSVEVAIIRTHLASGDVDSAMARIDAALSEDPGNRLFRYLKASVEAGTGEYDAAEQIYRDLLSEEGRGEQIWRALYALLTLQGKNDDAQQVLLDGLEANEVAPNLQWALAGEYERAGRIDEAIEIYDSMYQMNSNSIVIANNLASLITTYKDDEENLARAYNIARRLRGIDQPAFQDTYGWIALRRGQVDEALAHLEPAAEGLPNDPLVQFHLGMAYAQAGRSAEAIEQLRHAIDVAGPADTRPQFETARAEIARLEAEQNGQ